MLPHPQRPALGGELFHQCCKKQNHDQSLKQEARDYVYTFMHPEEYTLTESRLVTAAQAAGEEELDDSEDEDECQ